MLKVYGVRHRLQVCRECNVSVLHCCGLRSSQHCTALPTPLQACMACRNSRFSYSSNRQSRHLHLLTPQLVVLEKCMSSCCGLCRLAHIPHVCHGGGLHPVWGRGQHAGHGQPQDEVEVHAHRGCNSGVLVDEYGFAPHRPPPVPHLGSSVLLQAPHAAGGAAGGYQVGPRPAVCVCVWVCDPCAIMCCVCCEPCERTAEKKCTPVGVAIRASRTEVTPVPYVLFDSVCACRVSVSVSKALYFTPSACTELQQQQRQHSMICTRRLPTATRTDTAQRTPQLRFWLVAGVMGCPTCLSCAGYAVLQTCLCVMTPMWQWPDLQQPL